MAVQIEQNRTSTERLRQEIKTENRKFLVQLLIGLTTAVGVGVAIGRFWLFHS